ncbi:MAG: class I SAM-dependent RNA methyltransferase [Acidobacteria bacterium]|nr:MAG: class I SAM-dependent RNA methyltransferase [Acidobacteriota bacterium]
MPSAGSSLGVPDAEGAPLRGRVLRPADGAWFLFRPDGGRGELRVRGAVPGERILARPRAGDPGWADLQEILVPSPARREPPCPAAGRCGGCHWQHMRDGFQLRLKAERAETLLAPLRPAAPLEVSPSPLLLGYRWRARFQVSPGEPPAVGFHRPGSRATLDLERCPLLSPALQRIYLAVRERIRRHPLPGLTGFELSALPGAAGALLWLNPRDRPPRGWEPWVEPLLRDPDAPVAGAAVREGRAIRVRGRALVTGWSPAGAPLAAAAAAFLQANLAAADLLAETVRRYAGAAPGRRIAELYAGTGLLSWRCAASGAEVTSVERDPLAVAAARALPAPPRGLLRPLAGDAGSAEALLAGADAVIADPPRSGLGPLAHRLAAGGPGRIVLVSCSLASAARDLAALASSYALERAALVDLFPQTRHVELVCSLVRRTPGRVSAASSAPGHGVPDGCGRGG